MVTALGFKLFLMFAAINIGGMATFAACVLLALQNATSDRLLTSVT